MKTQLKLFKKRYSALSMEGQAEAIDHLSQPHSLENEVFLLRLRQIMGDHKRLLLSTTP